MYSIGIPTVLYKELLLIAEGKEENLLDEFLEKISSKETYLLDIVPDEARQHILAWRSSVRVPRLRRRMPSL